jgi:hypothetical protein
VSDDNDSIDGEEVQELRLVLLPRLQNESEYEDGYGSLSLSVSL